MGCINGLDSNRSRLPKPGTCLVCEKPTKEVLYCENCKDSPRAMGQVRTFTDSLFDPEILHKEIKGLLKIIEEKDKELGAVNLQVRDLKAVVSVARVVADQWKRSCSYDTSEIRALWSALAALDGAEKWLCVICKVKSALYSDRCTECYAALVSGEERK